MLCFVDANWPLIGGSFTTRGVDVLWQKKALTQLQRAEPLMEDDITTLQRLIAGAFPPA